MCFVTRRTLPVTLVPFFLTLKLKKKRTDVYPYVLLLLKFFF